MSEKSVYRDEPMKNHTTFNIGGNADFLVEPTSLSEIRELLTLLKSEQIPYMILGRGSNLLVGDKGIRAVVIKISNKLGRITIEDEFVTVQAGASLTKLAGEVSREALSGMEFAAGIPGTLGGAIVMNAGAYGGEMKDIVTSVMYVDSDGELRTARGAENRFGYRSSRYLDTNCVVLGCVLKLKKGNRDEILEKMSDFMNRRIAKQPLDKPSAGSAFKRPDGFFAGQLIETSGLKGFKIGEAAVSEKHAGFIVNNGGATAMDVKNLIEHIQKTVAEDSGVSLTPEIRLVGVF